MHRTSWTDDQDHSLSEPRQDDVTGASASANEITKAGLGQAYLLTWVPLGVCVTNTLPPDGLGVDKSKE